MIFSDTWNSHLQRIRALFERLAEARLTVNLSKCEFAKATITYLGRVVGQGCVAPVHAKVMAIKVSAAHNEERLSAVSQSGGVFLRVL